METGLVVFCVVCGILLLVILIFYWFWLKQDH